MAAHAKSRVLRILTGVVAGSLAFIPPVGAASCDQVVSYFAFLVPGAPYAHEDWHWLDPITGRDHLFLSSPTGFDRVRWDTTFTRAWFAAGDSIYTVEWKIGARPQAVAWLPKAGELDDWWFNPDSACWQLSNIQLPAGVEVGSEKRDFCELWQSNHDGRQWHIVRADTVPCEREDCGEWPWYQEPFARRVPVITRDELVDESSPESQLANNRYAAFDTATVATLDDPDVGGAHEWAFIESRSHPGHGLAFRLMFSSETVVSAPIYFVNLERRRKTLLMEEGHPSWDQTLMSEHCGRILVPRQDRMLLIEATSGRRIFGAGNVNSPCWVPAPRSH